MTQNRIGYIRVNLATHGIREPAAAEGGGPLVSGRSPRPLPRFTRIGNPRQQVFFRLTPTCRLAIFIKGVVHSENKTEYVLREAEGPQVRIAQPGPRIVETQTVELAREGSANMTTAKERLVEIIEQQPDDSSYEEIFRELAFARMIDRGLEDSRAGRTISNEEMERRIHTWEK